MPRTCTVCTHSDRGEIEKALISGGSFRDIAGQFNVSRSALERHKAGHLPASLVQANGAAEAARADDLLDQVRELQTKALVILAKAEKAGDLRTALQAIGQARQNLELLARLLGELQEGGHTTNVLIASPDWLRLRGLILAALDPYPEARYSVAAALEGVE